MGNWEMLPIFSFTVKVNFKKHWRVSSKVKALNSLNSYLLISSEPLLSIQPLHCVKHDQV
jgi:hypothetical protein